MTNVHVGSSDQREPHDIAGDENFVGLANAAHDLVCIVTLDGSVRFVNQAGRHWLGLVETNSLPAPFSDYLKPDDRTLAHALLTDALIKGIEQRSQLRFRHPHTGDDVLLSCQVFRLHRRQASDSLSAVVVGSAVQHGSNETASGAEAASLTRVSEMFAGVVGHDLRNPLNAILTSAHVLLHQVADAELKTTLGRIVSSGHRMQRMIDQLLDLTRIRLGSGIPLQPVAVDVAEIARQSVVEETAAHPEWRIDVHLTGDTGGTWDADRVAQMISNLLGNAIEHGVCEGGIDVTIDGTGAADVTIAIHNEGAIPAELLPILFSPFRVVQAKRHKSGGLGLGMFVTRQIALAHRGDVTVASSSDEGTTLVVRLPRERGGVQQPDITTRLDTDDMAVLEMLAAAPRATSVTAQLFGAVALHERAPQEYWQLFERYERLLDLALDHQTYKNTAPKLSDELRAVADRLGMLGAGAREVAELHARALKQRTRGVALPKAQALLAEGRLVSFELMGHLLSYYRRRSGLGGDV